MNIDIFDVPPAHLGSAIRSRFAGFSRGAQVSASAATARHAQLHLARDQHTWLRATEATLLRAVAGIAWITFERTPGEVVLLPGQSFVLAANTIALIGPLRGAVTLHASGTFEVTHQEALGTSRNGHRAPAAARR